MVEELAEDREPGVERRRQPVVGRHVRRCRCGPAWSDRRHGPIGGPRSLRPASPASRDRGRVVDRLVDDQVADDAWIGVRHEPRRLRVRRRLSARHRRAHEHAGVGIDVVRIDQTGEHLSAGAERRLVGAQVVRTAVHRAQAPRQHRARHAGAVLIVQWVFAQQLVPVSRMRLRDLDLAQDELQVRAGDAELRVLLGHSCHRCYRSRQCDRRCRNTRAGRQPGDPPPVTARASRCALRILLRPSIFVRWDVLSGGPAPPLGSRAGRCVHICARRIITSASGHHDDGRHAECHRQI